MSVFGIICETNPMHNGHKRLIDSARGLGAEHIVCVMSGNTTQRGEFTILDKYARAEALLKCGADLVIELPFPWCSGSAEYFSHAAVHILRNFCDTVIFGSECGDIDTIRNAAQIAGSEAFNNEYKSGLKAGVPAAKRYFDLLEKYCGQSFSSNDLLGIEYVKASMGESAELNFVTIKREGDDYSDQEFTNIEYPSATAIRKAWNENKLFGIERYTPKEALEVYVRAIESNGITNTKALDLVYLSFFRLNDGNSFENVVGANGGIVNRICEASHRATTIEEMISFVKTKRYTDANIRRTMLYALVGVCQNDLSDLPKEALILAANEAGRKIIAKSRKNENFRLVTKPADLDMTLRQNVLTRKINAIFTLANGKSSASEYAKKRPYISKNDIS